MSLKFIVGVKKEEYDKFVSNFPSTCFMQQSSWANIKNAWEHELVGLKENEKLVATALILKRPLMLGKKLFYIPRGFVIDYTNKKVLKEFVKNIKIYAKENGAIDIKIDPFICFNQDNIQNIRKNKGVYSNDTFVKNTKEIVKNIEECGFVHGGFKKEVGAYIQPRYTMVIPLKNSEGKFYTKEELRMTFPKNTRNYIGTYQEKRGVEFEYSKDINDVNKLVSMLKQTEKRQHISLRSENYFKKIMENYKDSAVLFFCYIDIDKYLKFLKEDIKENPDKKEFNEKQIEEAKKVKEEYGVRPLVGSTIVIMPTCNKGVKTAKFLYAGYNTDILPSLKITNGLMFYRLNYALDNGCDYCDLGGMDGNLSDHLSTFKSKFNPEVLELVGEYDLVISKFWFGLFNLAMKTLKFIRSKR